MAKVDKITTIVKALMDCGIKGDTIQVIDVPDKDIIQHLIDSNLLYVFIQDYNKILMWFYGALIMIDIDKVNMQELSDNIDAKSVMGVDDVLDSAIICNIIHN